MAPRAVDALLLACVHPVMHHRNVERVLWIYDVHLLASMLSAEELDELVWLARTKKVAGVCAHQLRLAQTAFGTVGAGGRFRQPCVRWRAGTLRRVPGVRTQMA